MDCRASNFKKVLGRRKIYGLRVNVIREHLLLRAN